MKLKSCLAWRIAVSLICLLSIDNVFANSSVIPEVYVSADDLANSSLVDTINKSDITHSGHHSLSDLLQSQSGITLKSLSGNMNEAAIGMRGFGDNAASNTLMLINGVPMTNSDLASPKLNFIPLDQVERIDIISGSEGVQYGDQAVAGLINIETIHDKKQWMRFSCNAGSYDAKGCRFGVNKNINKQRYYANFNIEHTSNYRQHNAYDQQAVSLQYELSQPGIIVDFNAVNERVEYPGALTRDQVVQDRRQAVNDTDYFRDTSSMLHVRLNKAISDDWLLQVDASQRQMLGNGVLYSPFTQSRRHYYLAPNLVGQRGGADIKSGMALQRDDYQLNSAYGDNVNRQHRAAVFVFADQLLAKKLRMSAGVRGAMQKTDLRSLQDKEYVNRALATTIGLSWDIDRQVGFFIRRAQSYRFPKADENASTATGINGLRTQRGVSYETGIKVAARKYDINTKVYYLFNEDEIAFDPTQTIQQPFGANVNLDPVKRVGLMLSGLYRVSHQVDIGMRYDWVDARFRQGQFSGKRIPATAEFNGKASLTYHINDRWLLYADAAYTGNQYSANDNANVAGLIGGYTIYNVNIGYDWKNLSASLRMNNIFNKAYYNYSVYQTSTRTEVFYPAAERSIMLNISYTA